MLRLDQIWGGIIDLLLTNQMVLAQGLKQQANQCKAVLTLLDYVLIAIGYGRSTWPLQLSNVLLVQMWALRFLAYFATLLTTCTNYITWYIHLLLGVPYHVSCDMLMYLIGCSVAYSSSYSHRLIRLPITVRAILTMFTYVNRLFPPCTVNGTFNVVCPFSCFLH